MLNQNRFMSAVKQLTHKQPLCYALDAKGVVESLPFIDNQLDTAVPKSKVSYLIRAEQQTMAADPHSYIRELPLPALEFADSEEFEREVARVQAKLAQKEQEKAEGKSKRKELGFPEVPKKLVEGEGALVGALVQSGVLAFENSSCKNLNIQICKKYGPHILKELMEVLEREKSNLGRAIEREREAMEQINQNRKYLQTESYQREHDIEERIKIMLNKRRKVD